MERKRSCGFHRIFTVAFERFGLVNVNDCPARLENMLVGLEPSAGARNRKKATVKIRRNAS